MTVSNYALVESGSVINIIEWDGVTPYTLPSGTTAVVIPSGTMVVIGATYANGVFTNPASPAPTLAQAQAVQSAIVSAACQSAIVAGFTSSALGAANTYPSDPNTQNNINTAAAHGGSIWCLSAGATAWAFTSHTAAQALQVQADLNTHTQAEQSTYAGLLAQINTAATVAAVEGVAWL